MSSTNKSREWDNASEDEHLPAGAEDSSIAVSCGGGITFIFDVTDECNAWMRVDCDIATGNER